MQLILVDGFWDQFFTFDPKNGDRDLITTALSTMQSLAATLSLLEIKHEHSFIQFPIKNNKILQFVLDKDAVIALIYDGVDPTYEQMSNNMRDNQGSS